MLSDSPVLKTRKSVKNRKTGRADAEKWYSDAQKLEAVKLWMLTGNLTATAAALNITYPTIRNWRYSQWWKDLVEELQGQENIELNQRLKRIAEKSLDTMVDRLENGDYILDKQTGQLVRKPVNLRDTTLAYNSLHDRRQRLLEAPRDKQDNKQVVDRLAALAAKFEEIAAKRQPINVTDIIYESPSNAITDATGTEGSRDSSADRVTTEQPVGPTSDGIVP